MAKDTKVDAIQVTEELLVEVWHDAENAAYGHHIYRLVDSATGKSLGKIHYHTAAPSDSRYAHWYTADDSGMKFKTMEEAVRTQAIRAATKEGLR